MKKLIIITLLVTIIACNKKTVPVITSRTTEPAYPVRDITNVKPDVVVGKTIYTTRCGRCHDLPKLDQYSAKRWDGILASMMPKARLNAEEELHITAYVKANAAK